jgi:hypothetical protein
MPCGFSQALKICRKALFLWAWRGFVGHETILHQNVFYNTVVLAIGPTLRAYHYSLEDGIALVGAFAKAGLNAEDVTRGLNTAFAKLAHDGKDPVKTLQELIQKLSDTKSAMLPPRN